MMSDPTPGVPDNQTLSASVDGLVEQGAVTVTAVDDLRAAIDRNSTVQRWAIGISAFVILVLALVVVDNRLQLQRLQRQFCPLVTLQIPASDGAPPGTQHGRDVTQASIDLARKIRCPIPK
jgi:hypothetical protein